MDKPTTDLAGKRLALHACCGPCLLEPYDAFIAEGARVTVVFFNPNIHPAEEYERRRDTLLDQTRRSGADAVELPYDPALWLEEVGPHARSSEERCRACYRLRLRRVAQWAAQNGFDAVATTLTVSPYQNPDAIGEEGTSAASDAGVEYVHRDFRGRYAEATRRSRELQMYRQNYCGCVISDVEAREQRARRKAQKADRTKQGS